MSRVTKKTLRETAIKRFTFKITKNENKIIRLFTLTRNPEEYTQEEPARVEITKTLGGAYIEEWGADLQSISLKGTTGYGKTVSVDGEILDGYQAFKILRNDIYRYFLEPRKKLKQFLKDSYELYFYNWEDGEYYRIQPKKFTLLRSKSRPLLYAYDFQFICLYPVTASKKIREDVILMELEDFKSFSNICANNLLDATDTIRRLRNGDNFDGTLTAEEILTSFNYPGIDFYMDDILEIVEFAEDVSHNLIEFLKGKKTKSNKLLSDIKDTLLKIRTVNDDLNKITPIPTVLINELHNIQIYLGGLLPFSNISYFV